MKEAIKVIIGIVVFLNLGILCNSCSINHRSQKKYYNGYAFIKYDREESRILSVPKIIPKNELFYGTVDSTISYSQKLKDTLNNGLPRYYLLRIYPNNVDSMLSITVYFSNANKYLDDLSTDSFERIWGILQYKNLNVLVIDESSNKDQTNKYYLNKLFAYTNDTIDYNYAKYLVYDSKQKRFFEEDFLNRVGTLDFKLSKDLVNLKYSLTRYQIYTPPLLVPHR